MVWPGLILALAVSADGFVAGVSYGMRRIALPLGSLGIVAGCTAAGMALSMLFGDAVSGWVSRQAAQSLAGAAIAAFGFWQAFTALVYQIRQRATSRGDGLRPLVQLRIKSLGLNVHVLVDPVQADADRSGVIDPGEAVALGVALGLDTLTVGFAAGVLGLGPWLVAGVALTSALLLWIGVLLGRSLGRAASSPWWIYVPALLLVALGVSHL